MTPHVVDIYHGNDPVDFHAMQAAGAVGVILKATTGSTGHDPKYDEYYKRAVSVFGEGCVHSYHWLTGAPADAQIANYLSVTEGRSGHWLDFEDKLCSLDLAVQAVHILGSKLGKLPGIYGSDADKLGRGIDAGHFGGCPLWIARYSKKPPMHKCHLWQFQGGEINPSILIGGKGLDLSTYMGAGDCADWLRGIA